MKEWGGVEEVSCHVKDGGEVCVKGGKSSWEMVRGGRYEEELKRGKSGKDGMEEWGGGRGREV